MPANYKITKKQFTEKLRSAIDEAYAELNLKNYYSSPIGKALGSEGRLGGYIEALEDCEAVLIHGFPKDSFHFWKMK